MDDFDMDMTGSDSPQTEWDRLSGDERKELLRSVFDDSEWYDGPPTMRVVNSTPLLVRFLPNLVVRQTTLRCTTLLG